jgi:hypothetical protein
MRKANDVVAYFERHPNASRREVADACSCSVSYVAGIVRSGATGEAGQAKHGFKTACVRDHLARDPEASASVIAQAAGCTVQTVYRIRKGSA